VCAPSEKASDLVKQCLKSNAQLVHKHNFRGLEAPDTYPIYSASAGRLLTTGHFPYVLRTSRARAEIGAKCAPDVGRGFSTWCGHTCGNVIGKMEERVDANAVGRKRVDLVPLRAAKSSFAGYLANLAVTSRHPGTSRG
jgi:hypothetical protein